MNEDISAIGFDDSFRFLCSSKVPCFNECCRDLNQFLTPNDIVCLKNGLGMSSGEFLETYTLQHTGPETGLPVVTLKPDDSTDEAVCPFVTEEGCRVYHFRPASCRTYPLARLASRSRETGRITEHYALVHEPHCLGFQEGPSHKVKAQTVREWIKSQGLSVYNEMNDLFMELISLKNLHMPGPMDIKSRHMVHLACYDLDNFRVQILEKGLMDNRRLDAATLDAIENDDVALLKLGIEWIKKEVFGVVWQD